MKFALDVQDEKTLNLVFYRHEGTTESRNEQSIDFDIVSAPAPPDAAAAMKVIGPRLDLVLDPFERQRLLDAIRAAPSASGLEPLLDAAQNSADEMLIVGLTPDNGVQQYIILLADSSEDADEHAVGMWVAGLPEEGPLVLETVYRLTRKNGAGEGRLKQIVLALAARLKTFLAS
jgi:hypothetical protein